MGVSEKLGVPYFGGPHNTMLGSPIFGNSHKGSMVRLLRGSWDLWGRVWALGAKVWDLTTRVFGNSQNPKPL